MNNVRVVLEMRGFGATGKPRRLLHCRQVHLAQCEEHLPGLLDDRHGSATCPPLPGAA